MHRSRRRTLLAAVSTFCLLLPPVSAFSSPTFDDTDDSEQAPVRILRVSSGRSYTLDRAVLGRVAYVDRRYRLTALPERLGGKILVRTSNEDDQVDAAEHVVLELASPSAVYVAFDERARARADWLAEWADTGWWVGTDDTNFVVYQRVFPAGRVQLGGNARAGTGAASHYLVFVEPGGAAVEGKTQMRQLLANELPATSPREITSPLPALPPGFSASLFATEPLVRNPASLCFDARGRLFVSHGPQFRKPRPDTPGDTISILLDDDGDGVADRTKTFATGFNSVQGMAWKGRDLWVANAPELTIVRDLDGDDEADEYVLVYADLGNLEHGIHGLNWAPDGRLYMSKGNSKGKNEDGRHAPKPFRDLWGADEPEGIPEFPAPQIFKKGEYRKGYHDPSDDWGREGGVLRCEDGGANLEIISRGFRNPWDIAFDDGFDWIGTDNDQNDGDRVFMPFFGAHFGWGHLWSYNWTGEDHAPTVPISAPVFHGSGTGVVFSASPRFPLAYRHVFLINDWGRKVTYVFRPSWHGSLMTEESGELEEFAREQPGGLYRPSDIEVGPDGALYVGGWGSGYGVEWTKLNTEMRNEGRIFKIRYDGIPLATRDEWWTEKRAKPLAEWSTAELIEDLSQEALPVWRVDAQEELVRRGPAGRDDLIRAIEARELTKAQETWAVWALARIDPEDAAIDFILARFYLDGGASINLKVQAIRTLGFRVRARLPRGRLPTLISSALRHADPRVRHAAVDAIWQARQSFLADRLLQVAASDPDRLTRYSAWNAVAEFMDVASRKRRLRDPNPRVRLAILLGLLARVELEADEVAEFANGESDPDVLEWALRWLVQTKPTHWRGKKPALGGLASSRAIVDRIERTSESRVRKRLLELLASLGAGGDEWERVTSLYRESSGDLESRTLLLRALAADRRSFSLLWEALGTESTRLREAAVDGFVRHGRVARDSLLELFARPGASAPLPPGAVSALARLHGANEPWTASGAIVERLALFYRESDSPIDRANVVRILADASANSWRVETREREQARAVLSSAAEDADPRVQDAALVLAAKLGTNVSITPREASSVAKIVELTPEADVALGESIFFDANRANCVGCHRIDGRGAAFAPDLSDVGLRADRETLARAIVEPSAVITEGFRAYDVVTDDGTAYSGLVLEETSSTLRLVLSDGRDVAIEKERIAERQTTERSAMPDNFGVLLADTELAALVAYLEERTNRSAGREQSSVARSGNLVSFERVRGALRIFVGGAELATYVYEDPKVARPFLANVKVSGGVAVTRPHPPVEGVDASDHAAMHPGVWLAFGDLAGADFWRNRGRVEHVRFTSSPRGGRGRGSFAVENRYVANGREICRQTCRYTIEGRPEGALIRIETTFRSDTAEFDFGEQEEMGLGVRLATGLTVKTGGRILNSSGLVNESNVWGKQADWCDYSGVVGARRIGLTLFAHPENPHRPWFHARDYGALVANPFGRRAGARERTSVTQGQPYRLRFGVLVYAANAAAPIDFAKVFANYVSGSKD